MTRSLLLAALLTLSASVGADSYFSSQPNGIGIRQFMTSVRGIGMGGGGLAAHDSLSLNAWQISTWRHVPNTRGTFSLTYRRIETDLGGDVFRNATAEFAGVSIAIPIQKDRWVFGAALQPYAQTEYRFRSDVVSGDSIAFTQFTETTGTINRAQLNLVWSPREWLGLAVHTNFYFGTYEDQYDFQFDNTSYLDSDHRVQYRLSGAGLGFSADVQPVPQLTLAGFVDLAPSMGMDVEYTSPIDNFDQPERTFDTFPMHLGVSGAYELGKRWRMEGSFSQQSWENALTTSPANYDSWSRLGVGVERSVSHARRPAFLSRFDWRLGYSRTQIGYRFNGDTVIEQAAHAGIGIPFSDFNNRIDVAVMAGIRGDQGSKLAEERFVNVLFSISVGELWFQSSR